MRDVGKGDKQRPLSIPIEQFDNNWETIFNKKPWWEDDKGYQDHPIEEHKPNPNREPK